MKLSTFSPLVLALMAAHFAFADEDDKPVAFDKLPAPVAKAMTDAAGGAKLKEVTSNDDNGTAAFEAVWYASGHRHQLTVSAESGRVIALEEEYKISETPKAVQAAITQNAGTEKITKIEKVTENGKVSYESTTGDAETRFDENGKVLGRD